MISKTVDTRVRRPPGAMALAAFTSSVDRFGISPLLVVIAVDFGVPLSAAVMTASVYFLTYGLTQPLWGMLSDRFGRLPVMRVALAGAMLFGLASAFAPNLIILTVARALTGGFFGAIIPASITYVGDTTSQEHRQSALSDLMAAVAVGTASATAAAGIIGQVLNWRIVFALAAVLALVALIPLLRMAEPDRDRSTGVVASLRLFFAEKWSWVIIVLAFVEGALVLGILTLLAPALETQGVDTSLAGLAVAAYGVATLVCTRLVRPVTARLSAPRVIALGGICLVLGLAIVTIQLSIATVVAAAVLLGGAWAFMHTGLQSWATRVVPAARGISVAFFAGAVFAGSAVSSAIAGALAEAGHWTIIFGVSAAVALVLTVAATAGLSRYLTHR